MYNKEKKNNNEIGVNPLKPEAFLVRENYKTARQELKDYLKQCLKHVFIKECKKAVYDI
jgi:hypothetical protein